MDAGQYRSIISFRPCRAPTVSLPFGARSSGHCVAGSDWRDVPLVKDFVQLFWTVRGCGVFSLDGGDVLLPEGWSVIYHRGECHRFGTSGPDWEYRFLTIDGAGCMRLVEDLAYPRLPVYSGPCPVELFVQLAEEVKDVSPRGQRLAAATAWRLMAMSCGGAAPSHAGEEALADRAEELIRQRFTMSSFNVNQLAELLGVHRSRLSRAFRRRRGVSVIEYLSGLRLNRAMALFKETRWTGAAIAAQSGFSNADYLAKAIRRATGMSPQRFRRQ